MPEYRRAYQPGGYYFFTVTTFKRKPFLTEESAGMCFKHAWQKVKKVRPFETIAFCLLPDHLHCIWRLPENDVDYSQRWASIKSIFSREYSKNGAIEINSGISRINKSERAYWQRRFWEHLIKDDVDLNRHIDYIHYNPIKHGLVENLEDWPWSTYHRYIRDGYYNDSRKLETIEDDFQAGE